MAKHDVKTPGPLIAHAEALTAQPASTLDFERLWFDASGY